MHLKWIALIMIWAAFAVSVSACAFAWGAGGRGTVLLLASVLGLFATICTAVVTTAGPKVPTDG